MLIAPIIGLVLLFALTIFQILLISGRPLGEYAWGGTHKTLPINLRISSVVSIVLYVLFAIFIASKAGIINFITNQAILNIGMWIFTSYFLLWILLNLISRSKKERVVMTPVATLLAISFLLTTLS